MLTLLQSASSLKSALCRKQEPAFQLWLMLGKLTSNLFANPAAAVLLVMAIAALLWWVARRYLRPKVIRLLGISFLGACLLFISPLPSAVSQWLLVGFLPADSGEAAAAIVVLGRGPNQNEPRAETVAALWQEARAPLIVPSGRTDAPIIAGLLKNQSNISREVIVQERCSLSTSENAEFTAAMMMPRGLSKIILVTDPLHMMRSLLTFKSFGFEVIPHPTALANEGLKQSRFIAFRESLGLISYAIMGRYSDQQVSAETIAEADKLIVQQIKNGAAIAIENY
ncbi:MAG: YdcF family protein [Phormidesmis sp.]